MQRLKKPSARLGWIVLGVLLVLFGAPSEAQAQAFTVNSTVDRVDATPGDGSCNTGQQVNGSPECTLRAAVQEASALLSTAHTITVPAGTYKISLGASCQYKVRSSNSVSSATNQALCIRGQVTLKGAGAASTILDGSSTGRLFFISADAEATIDGVTVQNGTPDTWLGDYGGGGLQNQGTVTIQNSIFTKNTANVGAAIQSSGILNVIGSTLTENTASSEGGGIWSNEDSTVNIDHSSITHNTANGNGGGIVGYIAHASISNSTIAYNSASFGGGIFTSFSSGKPYEFPITNTTIAYNHAGRTAGGMFAGNFSSVTFRNVTIAYNASDASVGGLYGSGTLRMALNNTLIANNTAQTASQQNCSGTYISNGYSLIGTQSELSQGGASLCDLTGPATNRLNVDPRLGALADNGGPTQTIGFLAGSPAIDAGSPLTPGDTDPTACTVSDQRGIGRPIGAACDIGAVEWSSPAANLSPTSLAFGNVATGTSSAAQTITLLNDGTAALDITGIALTGASADKFQQTNTCGTTLAAGSNCTISVIFAPTATGSVSATLTVTDAVGTQSTTLTGTGTPPPTPKAALTPASVTFGNVNTGSTSAAQTFTLSNAGDASLAITSTGISGTNAALFKIATNTCGASLAAGANCIISVTFAPAAAGNASATLSVYDAVGTQSSSLTGTGIEAEAALTPGSADFGSVNTGSTSAAQIFTLTNAGAAPLTITSTGLSGTNAASFKIGANTCGTSLAAGANCTIAVTFAPTTTGSASASISVVDSVGTQSASLTGTGTAPPAPLAVLSPANGAFGGVNIGSTSARQAFTLASGGNVDLIITSISISGTNASSFHIESNTCGQTLAPSHGCEIAINFQPTVTGNASATLSVVDNAGTQTAALDGAGVAVTPADFSLTSTSATQTVQRGSSVSYTMHLLSTVAGNPFANPVTFAASGLPAGATATFSPTSLVPGATEAATVTLTIAVPALSAKLTGAPQTFKTVAGAISLASLIFLWPLRRRRSSIRLFMLLIASLACVAGITACGSGTGFAAPGSISNITVTGTSGNTTHSTTVTLKIN